MDEINDSPTNRRTARSNDASQNFGRTNINLISQKSIANAHAVCVAAIEIGAETASRKIHT
jgi:hypothetical protein